ncbi:MAG: hypothetical protein KatS3mg011_1919 [Acidimicrobiia bacterium]|nr:MAG: hypothetical protein KatS3mg011_1919 [Acidimicrobiia bacterium]
MRRSPYLPEEDSPVPEPSPWGFRLGVAVAALYLLWRLVQGVMWLVERLT